LPEGSRTWLWRGVLALFVTFALLLLYALWLMGPTGKEAMVRIPRGASGVEVARVLEEAGLVPARAASSPPTCAFPAGSGASFPGSTASRGTGPSAWPGPSPGGRSPSP
jgi:hypothetical protein